jgi:GAF domain-containing protein
MDDLKQIEELQRQTATLLAGLESLHQKQVGKSAGVQDGTSFAGIAAFLALGEQADATLMTMVLQCAMYAVRAGGSGLTLFDRGKNKLVFQAAVGDGAEGIIGYEVPLEGSQHGLAFATGEIQSSTPIHTDVEKKTGTVFRNVLVAPLVVGEDVIGTISAVNKQDADHFSTDDMRTYQLFSELAAQVVRQKLREDAVRKAFSGESFALAKLCDFPGVSVEDDEIMLMEIFRNTVQIARHRPAMLEVCRQLTRSLLSGSHANGGGNG